MNNMKTKYLFATLFAVSMSGCNYLDIVPDERVSIEDAYNTPSRTEGYLYSCYGFMPATRGGFSGLQRDPLDRRTGGEITTYFKANEGEGVLTMGNYSPSSLGITKETWDSIWRGLRQCYEFLSILDNAKVYDESDRETYRAEVYFLIAYYHFKALQAYGPTFIIEKALDPNMDAAEIPERSSYDKVVEFIIKTLDEKALPGLKDQQTQQYFGRATKSVALALKSRVLLYAASPLFNGNTDYKDFVNAAGEPLISQEYSVKKWQDCADATLAAIKEAEKYHRLYQYADAGEPSQAKPGFSASNEFSQAQRAVRYCFMDQQNLCEVIWGDNRDESTYDIQIRSSVRQSKQPPFPQTNSIAVTLQMVEMFYTENGLPIDKDKNFKYDERYQLVNLPSNFDKNDYADRTGDKTIKLHLNREPRFYAWIGFPNGNYEISRYNAVDFTFDKAYVPGGLKMVFGGAHGLTQNRTTHYSVTGYLNKKFTHPGFTKSKVVYPFPVFRMAELYLNYAEALIEIGGDANLATAREYINKVRTRAGIPTIEDALNGEFTADDWKGKENDQNVLRQIVRQERQIEFYLENQRFWDLRRWKTAEVLDEHFLGWNIQANNIVDFFNNGVPVPNAMLENHFNKAQYLMPIPLTEIQKAPQIVQNPFYN